MRSQETRTHTTIHLSPDSHIDGKRIRDMRLEETMNALKKIGSKDCDVRVSENGQEICGYDSKLGMPYYHMRVKDVIMGYLNGEIR